MSFEIAVDVGGTFTDLVLRQPGQETRHYKSSSTARIEEGILSGIGIIAADLGLERQQLLERCSDFACGTTAATNAVLEGKGARTALLCTEGFRDTLLIREGTRHDVLDLYVDYPQPYVPRHLTHGIRERVNAEGGVEIPVDAEQVRAVARQLREQGVEAVAVCLLWSFLRPDHEELVGKLVAAELPGVPISLSHQVNPTLREYRRASAVSLDASLKPIVRDRIGKLESSLRQAGFAGNLSFVTSNGGRASSEEVMGKPVYLCLSGPSAAPRAASSLAQAGARDSRDVIAVDMGGTSFDVSIVVGGRIPTHREGVIDGHMFGVPSVDVKTIGAGGGSIARVDAGGFIHVGPHSAGAFPGPACYGRGGTLPTVTDANLARGLLNPHNFAGGQFALSVENARRAIEEHVAGPLGLSVEDAASLIGLAAEQSMVAAIEDITVRRGIDARRFVMVSGGAAGGLHSAEIAREMGMGTVLFPQASGVLSAYGIAIGDFSFNFTRSFYAISSAFNFEGLGIVLEGLVAEGRSFLERMQVPAQRQRLAFSVQARYAGQIWEITLPLDGERLQGEAALAALVARFHALHEQLYAVRAEHDAVEFIEWDLLAVGERPALSLVEPEPVGADATARARELRTVSLGRPARPIQVPVYERAALFAGAVLPGPALVEDPLFTCLIPEACTGRYTADRTLIVDIHPLAPQRH
ncbi:hydantoinase/oxoprolinase family protein [Xylophilus rhododendri]|uniref:Hydantoinase/oxoprolinase family protein n=1 Tax=Xylophilus rhododendri TaxID=2697032 RepID=A0A857JEQ4_9BURK|nr:hydantoinase/oxoprolinase family protein [Xylophilus rhododendri]QHJ01279.1 hydantoinase/oxoprolinase family protein [Xylophilus rhododendri]